MIRLPIRLPVSLPAVIATSAVALTLTPFAPAQAEVVDPEPIVIELPNATDVVADEQHRLVFVATGGSDSVEVFDWAGNAVESLTGIDNVRALTWDAATGTVYAAQSANNKIAAIDTATLGVAHYSVSATPGPSSLSVMNGLVYYGYGGGGIGVLDPSADTPTGASLVQNGASSPLIATGNNTIVMAEAGISPTNPRSYEVTELGATQIAYRWDTGGNAQDVVMSPDGDEVLIVSGFPYEHQAFDPRTLETLYTYQSDAYPAAAAYSTDASLVVTGTSSQGDDIRLHQRGQTIAERSWNLDYIAQNTSLIAGGLAVGGHSHIFAIAESYPDSYYLTIIEFDQREASSLSVDASSGATVGDDVQVTGQLFGGGSGTLTSLEGEEVTVTRKRGGVTTTVGTAVVDETGTFTISDTTTAGGTHQYTATWPGNGTYVAAAAFTTTDVGYLLSTLGISVDADTYVTGSEATVTVTLGHDDQSEGSVTISAVDFKGTHELATGSFDETGTLVTAVPITRTGKLIAEYAGDDTHAPATARSAKFNVEAVVTTVVDGYFRKRDGVHLVRENVDPTVTWTVSPRPITSGCAETVLQTQTSDGWRVLRRSGCRNSDTRDTVAWTLRDDRVSGTQWRTRLVTDVSPTHLPIRSDWTYLTFRAAVARVG